MPKSCPLDPFRSADHRLIDGGAVYWRKKQASVELYLITSTA